MECTGDRPVCGERHRRLVVWFRGALGVALGAALGGLLGVGALRAAGASAVAGGTTIPESPPATMDRSPVVARGEGLVIHADELEARVRRTIAEITNSGRPLSAKQSQALPQHVLEQMIFTGLAGARALPADRARAQFESRAFVDGLQRDLGSPTALTQKLAAVGLTEAAFRAEKLEESLALAVTEREVRASIHLPDADVLKYYQENPARWLKPEQVRVAHIMLTNQTEKGEPLPAATLAEKKAQLQKLREQIRAGGDFAALVKQYSDDKASLATGGEYRLVRGQMDPAFEQAALALKPGELSEVVTTPYGLHLLLVRERVPATQQPLAEVAGDIRELLVRREQELRVPEYATRLRREAKVEIIPTK